MMCEASRKLGIHRMRTKYLDVARDNMVYVKQRRHTKLWDTEGTLRAEANKRPNQEDGSSDHLLRHPYCQCSTIGKENREGGT